MYSTFCHIHHPFQLTQLAISSFTPQLSNLSVWLDRDHHRRRRRHRHHRHHRHHRRRHRHCWENRNGLQIHLGIVSHSTVLLHLVFKYVCLALWCSSINVLHFPTNQQARELSLSLQRPCVGLGTAAVFQKENNTLGNVKAVAKIFLV